MLNELAIKEQRKKLDDLIDKYKKLGEKAYRYRIEGIADQIEVLDTVLNDWDLVKDWQLCYEEDKRLR